MQKLNSWYAQHAAKVVLLAFLLVPAGVALMFANGLSAEQRNLSGPPDLPHSAADALKYPGQVDAWANDNFGLRTILVALNTQLRFSLFRQFPSIQVVAGKDGRIFLAAHQKSYKPYSAITEAFGYQMNIAPTITEEINQFSARTRARGLDVKLLIAPSSPVVYAEQLPDWLLDRFNPTSIPGLLVQASPRLDPAARRNLYFPYAEMRAATAAVEVFPKTGFHWMGDGPRMVAGFTMAHFWGVGANQGVALKTTTEIMPSDLKHLFPGLQFSSPVVAIDYKASAVDECLGATCFDARFRPIMEKLGQVSTYRNEKAPRGRLVIVSDSFGQPIAGWYSRYYKEVINVCINQMGRLDEQEMGQLRQYLFEGAKNDDIEFLYHDVTVYAGRIGNDIKRLLPLP